MMTTPKAKGGLFLASSLCDGLEDNDIKQVTTLLLNNEADPNVLIPTYGVTPFHLVIGNDSEAFAEEVTKLFLRHGGNPNVRSTDGLTPVHVAAAWGRDAVLELLLANGGDPMCLDEEGRSPFHYAFDGKYYKAIEVLGKYCDLKNKDRSRNGRKKYVNMKNQEDTLLTSSSPVKSSSSNSEYSMSSPSSTNSLFLKDSQNLSPSESFQDEKSLVTAIIDKLSTSLWKTSKPCPRAMLMESSEFSSDNPNNSWRSPDGFLCRNKLYKAYTTPKMRRKSSSKSPCTGYTKKSNGIFSDKTRFNDPIISRSPNFGCDDRLFCTRNSAQGSRTPSFRKMVQPDAGQMARSTPRRRKTARSSFRKARKRENVENGNDSSPEIAVFGKEDRDSKFSRNLAVKLDDVKYDDDYENNPESDLYALENLISNLKIENVSPKNRSNRSPKNHNLVNSRALNKDIDKDFKVNNLDKLSKIEGQKFYESDGSSSFYSTKSFLSVQEERKYEDLDEGVSLVERRVYVVPGLNSDVSQLAIPNSISGSDLRRRLQALGLNPGPITSTTHRVYVRYYEELLNRPQPVPQIVTPPIDNFLIYGEWINSLHIYENLDRCISAGRTTSYNTRCYNYLLLDPRITQNLPVRAGELTKEQIWTTFASGIFYVGKGSGQRCYEHFYQVTRLSNNNQPMDCEKSTRIKEIWDSGRGCVCLTVFQNSLNDDAMIREAAMIDALGVDNVTNIQSGSYQPPATEWELPVRRAFGRPPEKVIFMDREMVICWHPEPEFPYEHSLPLPKEETVDTGVLRIGQKQVAEVLFKEKKEIEVVEELARITYTTKHRWFPRSRDKYVKKTEPDRPYL